MKAVYLVLLGVLLFGLAPAAFCQGAGAPAPSPTPTVEQRLAYLEAYIANTDAQHPPASTSGLPGPAYNGWIMTAAVLVLFMSLPGLALSYAGLVRRKNALSVLAQTMAIAGMVTIIWWAVGYSLVFAPGKPWLGGLQYAMLHGVTSAPNTAYSPWVSQNVFCVFELMFAVLTPSVIIGATAERMRFAAVLSFIFLWMFLVFIPVEHMVWGVDGAMNGIGNPHALIKSIDFAGGLVVHMTSGWSSLVICILVGKRKGYGKEKMPPHSIVLCMVGTAMLWVGWYGFNAGSALGADSVAANAFLTTTLSAAVASCAWALAEFIMVKKSSTLGLCSGALAGLVTVAPACGYVSPTSAVILGLVGGGASFFAVVKLKAMLGYDDALDAFGVHAVCGTLGVLLAGFMARGDINHKLLPNLGPLLGKTLWVQQIEAILVTLVVAVAGTFVAGMIVRVIIGLRPAADIESIGLDLSEHGEEGYIL